MKKKYGIPYAMVMMWTLSNRLPYYGEDAMKHLGMWGNFESTNHGHPDYNAIVNNIFYNKSNEFSRLYNITEIGRQIFADKTNYFDGSFFCETAHYGKCYDRFGFKNDARDLVHAGPEDLERIANEIKTIDTTRPVTSAMTTWDSGWDIFDPLMAAQDVCGYNYQLFRNIVLQFHLLIFFLYKRHPNLF